MSDNRVTLSWCHDLVDPDGKTTELCEYLFDSYGAYAGVRWFCDPRECATNGLEAEFFATLSLTLGLCIADAREEGLADVTGLLRRTMSQHTSLFASKVTGQTALRARALLEGQSAELVSQPVQKRCQCGDPVFEDTGQCYYCALSDVVEAYPPGRGR